MFKINLGFLMLLLFQIEAGFGQESPDTVDTTFFLEKIMFFHGDSANCIYLKTEEEGVFAPGHYCQFKYENSILHRFIGKDENWKVQRINYVDSQRVDTLIGRLSNSGLSIVENFWFSHIQNKLGVGWHDPKMEAEESIRLTFPVSREDSTYDFCVLDFHIYSDTSRVFTRYGLSTDSTGLSLILTDSLELSMREHKKAMKFFNKIQPVDLDCDFTTENFLLELKTEKDSTCYVLGYNCAMDNSSRDYKYKFRLYHYLRHLCLKHFDWYPEQPEYYL